MCSLLRMQPPCFYQAFCAIVIFPSMHCFALAFWEEAPFSGPSAGPWESCSLPFPHLTLPWGVLFLHTWRSLYILSSQSLLKIWIEPWQKSDGWRISIGFLVCHLDPHPPHVSWSVSSLPMNNFAVHQKLAQYCKSTKLHVGEKKMHRCVQTTGVRVWRLTQCYYVIMTSE